MAHAAVANKDSVFRQLKRCCVDIFKQERDKWRCKSYAEQIESANKGQHPLALEHVATDYGDIMKALWSEEEFDRQRVIDPQFFMTVNIDTPNLWSEVLGRRETGTRRCFLESG